MREAIASYIAGERIILESQANEFRIKGDDINPSPETIELHLVNAYERGPTRIAFFAAYRMLENLLSFSSMNDVLRFLDILRTGSSRDEASNEVFGVDYDSLLDKVRIDREGSSREATGS
jgi:hypothetical protein